MAAAPLHPGPLWSDDVFHGQLVVLKGLAQHSRLEKETLLQRVFPHMSNKSYRDHYNQYHGRHIHNSGRPWKRWGPIDRFDANNTSPDAGNPYSAAELDEFAFWADLVTAAASIQPAIALQWIPATQPFVGGVAANHPRTASQQTFEAAVLAQLPVPAPVPAPAPAPPAPVAHSVATNPPATAVAANITPAAGSSDHPNDISQDQLESSSPQASQEDFNMDDDLDILANAFLEQEVQGTGPISQEQVQSSPTQAVEDDVDMADNDTADETADGTDVSHLDLQAHSNRHTETYPGYISLRCKHFGNCPSCTSLTEENIKETPEQFCGIPFLHHAELEENFPIFGMATYRPISADCRRYVDSDAEDYLNLIPDALQIRQVMLAYGQYIQCSVCVSGCEVCERIELFNQGRTGEADEMDMTE